MLDGEAALAKVELHHHSSGEKGGKGIIRRIRETIDPEAAAMIDAAVDMQRLKSTKAMAQELVEFGVPSDMALVWAYEMKRGADKLTNFSGTLDEAAKHIDEEKTYKYPSDEFMGSFTPVAEKATDEYARELLGKVLAGEMETPGSFSKKSLSILSEMGKADAEAFAKLCGRCVGDKNTGPIPMLIGRNEPFAMSSEETDSLDSLGLTNSLGSFFSSAYNAPLSNGLAVAVGDRRFLLKKENGSLEIANRVFTKFGLELSTLFPLGGESGFSDELISRWKRDGIEVSLIVEVLDGGAVRLMRL